MTNEDFEQFKKGQKRSKRIYLDGAKHTKDLDPETNQRSNTGKNVGATGKEFD